MPRKPQGLIEVAKKQIIKLVVAGPDDRTALRFNKPELLRLGMDFAALRSAFEEITAPAEEVQWSS